MQLSDRTSPAAADCDSVVAVTTSNFENIDVDLAESSALAAGMDSDVTFDFDSVKNASASIETNPEVVLLNKQQNDERTKCTCQSDYCDCNLGVGISKVAAEKIYGHLGSETGRQGLIDQNYRLDVIHIWGTDQLSTGDILQWLKEYKAKKIEWIDDSSCNVVLEDELSALKIIVDFTEPFDRRVAVTAALALVSTLSGHKEGGEHSNAQSSMQLENVPGLMPSAGNWYKALSVPKDDVKQPGAERRSKYYKIHGNPNYGNMPGVLSKSFRRRIGVARRQGDSDNSTSEDSRSVNRKGRHHKDRELVSYAGLYDNSPDSNQTNQNLDPLSLDFMGDDIDQDKLSVDFGLRNVKTRINPGHRRQNNDQSQNHGRPKKYPRKENYLTLSDRWSVLNTGFEFNEPRLPWNGRMRSGQEANNTTSYKVSFKSGNRKMQDKNPRHSSSRASQRDYKTSEHVAMDEEDLVMPLAAITLVPDRTGDRLHVAESTSNSAFTSKKLLASMNMIADLEEAKTKKLSDERTKSYANYSKSKPVFSRLG